MCKTTAAFLEKIKTHTGIAYMPFQHIPMKSPDVSPRDYCVFGNACKLREVSNDK